MGPLGEETLGARDAAVLWPAPDLSAGSETAALPQKQLSTHKLA